MTEAAQSPLSPLQFAALAVRRMRARVFKLESARNEPIAIVGIGCRFPGGVENPEDYWKLLARGTDAIREIPKDRWDLALDYDPNPAQPAKISRRQAGLLQHIDQFDADFFKISPREAEWLDPQQRLLLEVAWEAFENAGLAPHGLAGGSTGVFVGMSQNDHAGARFHAAGPAAISAADGTGNGGCFAAGRLSFFFGFHGPNLAVDTACSSSLVAVHLACQSLRCGECDLALAGGVELILSPGIMRFWPRSQTLAPDGRCKTFDASADGLGRGEGCGLIVLRRLSDALARPDRILAVIRGSAVNHNGAGGGLTAPNADAQTAVIAQALKHARVVPAEVSMVEAHGAGLAREDSLEVSALAEALGAGRSFKKPLIIGSVKTNIGHLGAAAGIAGLIKVLLCLEHREIPPHLHWVTPSPHIRWKALPVFVPTCLAPWTTAGKRIAGVSAFGVSGTNAHVILEEAPPAAAPADSLERPCHLLCLTARTEPALRALAERFERYFAGHDGLAAANVAYTANVGRTHFNHRLAVLGSGIREWRARLEAYREGRLSEGGWTGCGVRESGGGPVWVFPGEGAGVLELGWLLWRTQPEFRRVWTACADVLRTGGEAAMAAEFFEGGSGEAGHADPGLSAASLYALEYGLARLWRSWGLEPAMVTGFGVGEYVAASVAGVMSWESGLGMALESGRTGANGGTRWERRVNELVLASPRIGYVSGRTGEPAEQGAAERTYWLGPAGNGEAWTHVLNGLREAGHRWYMEVGLRGHLEYEPRAHEWWLAGLGGEGSLWEGLASRVGWLYGHGIEVNWEGWDQGYGRRRMGLPTYPFERQRYEVKAGGESAPSP